MADILWYILGFILLIWCGYWPVKYWRLKDKLEMEIIALRTLLKEL